MLARSWPLLTAAEMRALDRDTIERLAVPGELLMELAGAAVANEAVRMRRKGAPVWIFCGTGNNGGDGLVAARHLRLRGVPLRVVWVGDPAGLAGDAAANAERARRLEVPVAAANESPPPGAVLVDAIFGTGLARPVGGAAAMAMRRIAAARPACPVLAVDLPSGIDADTGQVLGEAVHADATVTLGVPKLGLALEPGRSRAGRIVVARIGIRDPEQPGAELWTRAAAAGVLPARPRDGHKGRFGHVLVVAGSRGKSGAAGLAGLGAARIGAGLVTIACPEGAQPDVAAAALELMTAALPEAEARALGASAEKAVLDLASARDVVALGPGLGRAPETQALVQAVALAVEVPLVLDADGLVAFAGSLEALRARRAPTVLTPHPGEAALLLGTTPAEVNRDRVAAARRLAAASGAVVALKGAASVVCSEGEPATVNPTGGPALGAGGTGDVLTGVIAGLIAQGLAAPVAARLGVFVHGFAADRLAASRGGVGLLASEVASALPDALRALGAEAGGSIGEGDLLAFPEPG